MTKEPIKSEDVLICTLMAMPVGIAAMLLAEMAKREKGRGR